MEEKFKYEKELDTVKKYIALNINCPKYKVSAETGVSLDVIRELIDQGFLAEEESVLRLPKRNNMKVEEKRELVSRLSECMKNIEKTESREESRLVKELKEIKEKDKKNFIEEIER